jgi:general secretion pathway protein K
MLEMKQRADIHERGVALLMVIVMIAITSALLVSLAESSFISMRLNRAVEQRIKAEYMLKSAFNVARVLIKNDSTPTDERLQDAWMILFGSSAEVPPGYLDLQEPNVKVQMVIKSEKGKIPLLSLVSGSTPDLRWTQVLTNLFQLLGFDNEQRPDIGARCRFEQPSFCTSIEMVANLIDYLDQDDQSHPGPPAQGIESDLPMGETFRNKGILDSPEELLLIPGFTPKRVQAILPLITIESRAKVNANAAEAPVLQAIANLDPGAPADAGIELVNCRDPNRLGSFKNISADINTCLQARFPSLAPAMAPILDVTGNIYRVIAHVEYGQSGGSFMGTAVYETQGQGKLPKLRNMFLY